MSTSPYDSIPPVAGLATYAEAARVGWSVDENVRRLLRLHWVERRLMAIMIAHLTAEPVWEVKCALAFHQWLCAQHVDALRARIGEMRSPVPPLDAAPQDAGAVDAWLDELIRSNGTGELLTGMYAVALPALAAAYRAHLAGSNPLVDQPTRHVIHLALADTEQAIAWGAQAMAAVGIADAWRHHLLAYLAAAGEITGERESSGDELAKLPDSRATAPFVPDLHPRRDERFHGSFHFDFPPHVVYNMPNASADERNLALLCKRALEMDVPEMMASFITERRDQPWEFYRDYSRQLWDEARHAMMGTVALEARGIDWKRDVPLNVSFALRLNLHATPVERQMMLFAIEQSLMPGDTGKRYEYETAVAARDTLSAHFHDYDWADEVLHAQIGRRVLQREGISANEARERAHEIHGKTWAALEQYQSRDAEREQREWWPAFVRRVLGHDSVLANAEAPALNIFSK